MSDLEPTRRGRELADAVRQQLEQVYRCPFNAEEGRRLDTLQGAFAEWANQFPELANLPEFADERLRPRPPKIADEKAYLIRRRQWALDELCAIPGQLEQARVERAKSHVN